MGEIGKYLYCIIDGDEGRNFGHRGIGDRNDVISTIGYRDISAVVSNSPMTKYVISNENMMGHQRTIEKVMKDYTVLPVRFCTIASSAEEVRNLLRMRYLEFKNLLKDMDNKIELGIKALWKNMETIFQEIGNENREIRSLKAKIASKSSERTNSKKIDLGKMVQSALEAKKEAEGEKIIGVFRKISHDFRINKVYGDNMFLNAAFLVDKAREKECDNLVEGLETRHRERMVLKYVGPVPPFNFVNIVVEWQ